MHAGRGGGHRALRIVARCLRSTCRFAIIATTMPILPCRDTSGGGGGSSSSGGAMAALCGGGWRGPAVGGAAGA
jgi:hypothetical protein